MSVEEWVCNINNFTDFNVFFGVIRKHSIFHYCVVLHWMNAVIYCWCWKLVLILSVWHWFHISHNSRHFHKCSLNNGEGYFWILRMRGICYYMEIQTLPSLFLSALLNIYIYTTVSGSVDWYSRGTNIIFHTHSNVCTLTYCWRKSVFCRQTPTSVPPEALYECKLLFTTFCLNRSI